MIDVVNSTLYCSGGLLQTFELISAVIKLVCSMFSSNFLSCQHFNDHVTLKVCPETKVICDNKMTIYMHIYVARVKSETDSQQSGSDLILRKMSAQCVSPTQG